MQELLNLALTQPDLEDLAYERVLFIFFLVQITLYFFLLLCY